VMRLASQLHCLWSETGPIPVRGATPGRVMATQEPPKLQESVRFAHPVLLQADEGDEGMRSQEADDMSERGRSQA